VSVRCHVWGDEHPLRKLVVLETRRWGVSIPLFGLFRSSTILLFIEHGGILDDSSSLWAVDNRVIENRGTRKGCQSEQST
jgi:hypothetical protein